MPKLHNINVGILGHVDSGKTTLAKALSTVSSTACFDKHPQSKERGITIDLGFSSFSLPLTCSSGDTTDGDRIQFTLVDCPGHSSLIRTVVGGANIIDFALLIIDITKGLQAQSAECILIAEILEIPLLVILNKTDLLPSGPEGATRINLLRKRLKKKFESTRWPNVEMVPVAARVNNENIYQVVELKKKMYEIAHAILLDKGKAFTPGGEEAYLSTNLSELGNDFCFYMYVDHCFALQGKGVILTGTVVKGRLAVGDTIDIPALGYQRKIRSMQVFHQTVSFVHSGDRVAICVSNVPPEKIERALVCAPNSTSIYSAERFIARVRRIRYYKAALHSKQMMLLCVGHSTCLARVHFFYSQEKCFSLQNKYCYLSQLPEDSSVKFVSSKGSDNASECTSYRPLRNEEDRYCYYALIELEHSLIMPHNATIIGMDQQDVFEGVGKCRIALEGKVVFSLTQERQKLLKIMRWKSYALTIDRIIDEKSCVIQNPGRRLIHAQHSCTYFQPPDYHPDPNYRLMEQLISKNMLNNTQKITESCDLPFCGTLGATFGTKGKIKIQFAHPVFGKRGAKHEYRHYQIILHKQVCVTPGHAS